VESPVPLSASVVVVFMAFVMVFVFVRVMPRSPLQQISNRGRNQGDDEESYSAHMRLCVMKKTAIASKPAMGTAKRKPFTMSPFMRMIMRSYQTVGR
jgi:ABC-type dipeptide/oligopeptide/nickel transport system permease component